MAEQIFKELKTKIALKYIDFATWSTEAFKAEKPLKGEVWFCEVPQGNATATTAPTVLFKVGDGVNTFGALNWCSALAADVHAWAKKSQDEFITWVNTVVEHPAAPVITTGSANGTIAVDGTDVAVKGLGSAAYTDANAYATAEQGGKADNAAAAIATYGDIVTHDVAEFATAEQGGKADTAAATIATYGDIVTHNITEFATSNQGSKADSAAAAIATYGDIVTHDASEFETAGAASEAEGRINETLKNYYTKTEADAEFATPAEVIEEVNKAIATVADSETTANITALVDYVEKNAGDLTGLITEVYGSAAMTGNSRIDEIAAKAAMNITSDDIDAWNTEKGVKAIVDANKATWDKAGTALQAADLADYAKTADVVTNDEFTTFEATNTEAINNAKKAGEDAATNVKTGVENGTIVAAKATDADKLGGIEAANYVLKSDIPTDHLTEVVANNTDDKHSGIKVTDKNKIEIDDEVIFILNANF